MTEKLTIGKLDAVLPQNPFLILSKEYGKDPGETALEAPVFDFALTEHQMGARIVQIPADRAFQDHIHPYAYHFILVLKGTAVMVYNGERQSKKSKGKRQKSRTERFAFAFFHPSSDRTLVALSRPDLHRQIAWSPSSFKRSIFDRLHPSPPVPPRSPGPTPNLVLDFTRDPCYMMCSGRASGQRLSVDSHLEKI